MTTVLTAKRPVNLDALVDKVARTNKPVQIRTPNSTCVLVSGDEWRGIQETISRKSFSEDWEPIEEVKKAARVKNPLLERINGVLVYMGRSDAPPEAFLNIIEKDREERMAHVWGAAL